MDVVNEYRALFPPLLSISYALVFDTAGILSKKLHISIKLQFQLLVWWKKKVCETALIFKRLKCERISEVKSTSSATFYPPLILTIVVVLFWSQQSFCLVVLFWSFHFSCYGRFILVVMAVSFCLFCYFGFQFMPIGLNLATNQVKRS